MTPLAQGVLVVCAVVITVALVLTLLAMWRAANRAEAVLGEIQRQVRPLSAEVEALTRDMRLLSHQATEELARVSTVLRGLEDVSVKVARVAGVAFALTRVGQMAGLASGLKKGASVFASRLRSRG
jgi:uncharacterized protein YoxC